MTDRSVPITFDRVRHLRFTPNTIVDIEEVTGKDLPSFFQDASVRTLRAMLWGGLKWEDPDLTLTSTGDLIQVYLENGGSLPTLFDACAEGFITAGWFKPKEKKEKEKTGKSGGRDSKNL